MSEYIPGMNCTCCARCQEECACVEVDWTDPIIYKLRRQLDEAIELLDNSNRRFFLDKYKEELNEII